jgi:soluble lytic murein transglycosylase
MRTASRIGLTLLAMATAIMPLRVIAQELAVSELGQGISLWSSGKYIAAVPHLRAAQRLTKLADYDAWYLASAQQLSGDIDGALSTLTAYRQNPVEGSRFAGKISLLYGRALLDRGGAVASGKALDTLQTDYKMLPQPEGDFALGLAYEALGEQPQAALAYERVYYEYPNTELAAQASTAMDRLRTVLGKDFPVALARQQLDRAEKWLAAKEYAKARAEYFSLSQSLPDPEKDEAKVGIGLVDYLSGDAAPAFRYLKDLHLSRLDRRGGDGAHAEPEAERLFYVVETARKTGDDDAMMEAVHELDEKHAQSPWRLKALIAAGNRFLLTNDRDRYEPLFRAAFDSFPADSSTAYAHWKVAWDSYLADKMDAPALLREQIDRYPDESHSGSALYFLGRAAERSGNFEAARAYYERLNAQFPHYFYGVLARQRLADPKVAHAAPDATLAASLAAVNWPMHPDLTATEPNPATRDRIDRARLLRQANLSDQAEAELRFGAKMESEQPQLLALELARNAPSPFAALRIMKSFSGDYLSLPTSAASTAFWQMLFPMPYRDEVFSDAQARNLDPFNVAALIRQESEFNPRAHSPANAYGLMQLIPSTGRLMAKHVGMRPVGSASLLNPSINIRLGIEYLRGQLDNWNGDWSQTLAAYNAGPTHVHQWSAWASYREPAEFVESIPFNETREYVQAVLRNADFYRELYSGKPIPQPVAAVASSPKPAVKLAASPTTPKLAASSKAPATRKVVAARRPRKRVNSKTQPVGG